MLEHKYNKVNVPIAKTLRKNMTKQEKHLWYDFLREHPIKFTRQKVLGKYIVDFYCAKANLVIEIDGSQHYDETGLKNDEERTEYLSKFNLTVIRIPNNAVNNNFNGVCEYIVHIVKQSLSQNLAVLPAPCTQGSL